jgi:hypothetical protein
VDYATHGGFERREPGILETPPESTLGEEETRNDQDRGDDDEIAPDQELEASRTRGR